MDDTTETLASFAAELGGEHLSGAVTHAAKRLIVDAFGCAIGGLASPPAQIARRLASDVSGRPSATIMGVSDKTTVDMAAFANTVMVRYLDYNDMYFAPGGGGAHPSDLIPTALAVGEAFEASGREVLTSIVLGYEVLGVLCGSGSVRLRERGWDQGLYTVVTSSLIAGRLMGLSQEQLAHAVSLAITPHVPTRHTRVGELSMWKGCATADAARNGIFAARLAAYGMTGPPKPFEGAHAIFEQVTGPFELHMPTRPDSFVIENVCTKFWPVEYNAQGLIELALRLRDRVDLDEIAEIQVDTYWLAYSEIGSQPEKWDPHTRETADHSIPYLLAVALVEGRVGLDSFDHERLQDPVLHKLMQRIRVAEVEEFSQRFPAELVMRISIAMRDGSVARDEISHPIGHAKNPMEDEQINAKFEELADALEAPEAARELRDSLWSLEKESNVATLVESLAALRMPTATA